MFSKRSRQFVVVFSTLVAPTPIIFDEFFNSPSDFAM
jgi:hypothetical protein